MSMFCYQCQETAMGTGCTLKGVCGKTSEVANLQDLLLFVVRGIAVYNEHLRKMDILPNKQTNLSMMLCSLPSPTPILIKWLSLKNQRRTETEK